MVRSIAVFFAALFFVATLWVGARLGGLSLIHPAQAQSTKSAEARKWEYCTIVGVNYDRKWNTSSATIGFLTSTGRRVETLDCGSTSDPLAVAFAKLGSEGWELIGQMLYNNRGPASSVDNPARIQFGDEPPRHPFLGGAGTLLPVHDD